MKYKYDPETGVITNKHGDTVGHSDSQGYVAIKVKGKSVKAHRFIYELIGVDIPDDMEVDHINHNKTDNRWENLRLVSRSDNQRNRGIQKNNKSGVVGVYWHNASSRWEADLQGIYLGRYKDKSKAVDARKLAEVAYGYHENHGKDVA